MRTLGASAPDPSPLRCSPTDAVRADVASAPGDEVHFDENEPQSAQEGRPSVERADSRATRRAAPLDSRGAHVGAALPTVAPVHLCRHGKPVALDVVSGAFLLWSASALVWAYADGDHGRHALQRGAQRHLRTGRRIRRTRAEAEEKCDE